MEKPAVFSSVQANGAYKKGNVRDFGNEVFALLRLLCWVLVMKDSWQQVGPEISVTKQEQAPSDIP